MGWGTGGLRTAASWCWAGAGVGGQCGAGVAPVGINAHEQFGESLSIAAVLGLQDACAEGARQEREARVPEPNWVREVG